MTETQVDANNKDAEWNAARLKLPEQADCDHVWQDYDFRCQKCGMLKPEDRITRLVPGKSDADRAAEIKQRAHVAMAPVLALIDEAAAAGFLLRWQGITPNAFGKHELVDLHLLKKF